MTAKGDSGRGPGFLTTSVTSGQVFVVVVGGCVVHRAASLASTLDASWAVPCCDSQKYLQTLPNAPWGALSQT